MTDRYTSSIDLHLVLRDDQGRVLLGERKNTGYMDGAFHLIAGHLEANESASRGVIREALEEAGIVPESMRLAHVMHHYTNSGRMALFYEPPAGTVRSPTARRTSAPGGSGSPLTPCPR